MNVHWPAKPRDPGVIPVFTVVLKPTQIFFWTSLLPRLITQRIWHELQFMFWSHVVFIQWIKHGYLIALSLECDLYDIEMSTAIGIVWGVCAPNSYYYGAIKPYVHYMPFWESSQYDVYDAVHWLETHQDLAMKMARRGRIFAQGHLNKRARMCYWRTLLVEYAELMKFSPSLDRYPNAILLDNDPLMQKQPKTLMGNNIWHIGADAHRRSALRRSSRLS